MTGKENLLLDEISCEARHIQNHIYGCDGSVDESVECIVANCNSLEKIFNELKEENTKYKRAFEILKDKLQFENLGEMQSGIVFRGYFEDCFNEDEYELLEELMGNENS